MNYVDRHFGDWARDTAHLSMLEDGAYNRLCDVYYVRESPLPEALDACCRLVRAAARPERQAVRTVLAEFFVLTPDGWRHKRCDEEIARYQSGEPEREAKKANVDNRMKRHREERGRLFKELTDAGAHADWNISISELRKLVQRVKTEAATGLATPAATPPATARETKPATAPATPATATHSPPPTSQTPLPNEKQDSVSTETAPSPAEVPLSARERVWALGVALLGDSPGTRSLLGKLAKVPGEEALAEILAEATLNPPINPRPWVIATCEARSKQKPKTNGHVQADLLADPKPEWAIQAGFANRFDAENAGCKQGNAANFRAGRRVNA